MCTLAKLVESPAAIHFIALWRVFKYILDTKYSRLKYGSPSETLVSMTCVDANKARTDAKRESVSGCLVMMHGAAGSWIALPQEVFALPGTEAE